MRTIYGPDLMEWEAWPVPGRAGVGAQGTIVFRCISAPSERARVVGLEGGRPAAEARLVGASDDELRELLERSRPIY